MFVRQMLSIVAAAITVILSVTALGLVNIWLAIIILVAVIPGVLIQVRLSRLQIRHWNGAVDNRRTQVMIEYGVFQPRTVAEPRLYGLARHLLALRRWHRDADEKTRMAFERRFLLPRLAADALEVVAELATLIWITLQIIGRQQPIGQFLFVQQAVTQALAALNRAISEISNMDESMASLRDYDEFMRLPSSSARGIRLEHMPEHITLEHVSYRYPNSTTGALVDVNIEIHQGERVAVVGANGAGKSTLVKVLSGIYEPSHGKILLDDVPLRDISQPSWHEQIAVLHQDYLGYEFATACENIQFGRITVSHTPQRLNDAMTNAQAADFIRYLSRGEDTLVSPHVEHPDGTPGTGLSSGQWQRLSLARNFYRNASLVILDEPTSAIDAQTEAQIFDHLFADVDRTLIVISHRLSTIERADRIIVLQDGKVADHGTYTELTHREGPFLAIFGSQIRPKT